LLMSFHLEFYSKSKYDFSQRLQNEFLGSNVTYSIK